MNVHQKAKQTQLMAEQGPCATAVRRRWGLCFCAMLELLLASGATAQAQWTPYATPEFEAAGSYSLVRANGANSSGFNLNGGSGSFIYNFKYWFAIVGDVGSYHFGGLPAGLSSNMITFAGGPRITFRSHPHFIPYVQVLVGGARLSATSDGIHAADNALVLMPGVGVDMAIHRNFAIRAVQVDYLGTRFPLANGATSMENNFRISAGIVFRFGER